MNKLLLLPLLTVLFFSCSSSDKEEDKGAWIGGEIVNPITEHVILTKNDRVLDTVMLDENNRFLIRIDSVEKGIYNFIHNEYQIIYVEPGDSILLRVNTVDFDESLAFTGEGAVRNNFLINMFLYNEAENKKMPPIYQLSQNDFIKKLDSMKEIRLKGLKEFKKKHNPCKSFIEVAEANINYDHFTKRELYPYAHYGRNNMQTSPDLPKDYYNFRSEIDYNNKNLQSYYTYFRFLMRHFDYLAFENYRQSSPFNNESSLHTATKLDLINKKVTLETLKNSLLRSTIRYYLINSQNVEETENILKTYFSLTSDQKHKEEIQKLSDASIKLAPGNMLPNLTLVNSNNQATGMHSVINRPAIIYFWSINSANHFRNVHSKAEELKQKYPEFDFIGISTNEDQEAWKRIIQRNKFDKKFQYRFQNPTIAIDELVISLINKVMIVDGNSIIIDNNNNMFKMNFEEELLGILNQ